MPQAEGSMETACSWPGYQQSGRCCAQPRLVAGSVPVVWPTVSSWSSGGVSAAEIADYLDASTTMPASVDLLFIPGTRLQQPAIMAAQLMAQGIATLVVVTGGVNRATGRVEADALRATLLDRGVVSDQIIVERSSANTLQNVVNARPLIAEALSDRPLTSVLAVCKWMHSRRVLMTLKANLPPGIRYYAKTYAPDGLSRRRWLEESSSTNATGDVMSNWFNLRTYLHRGDVAEVSRDGDAYV
jgi:uncharacterized SAM-binding protein YcdF (DUF218 family)